MTDDRIVLGIHSTVGAETQGSFNQLVDGHAWISVTRNGQTQYYGLWPDEHPRVQDNGPGSDIRTGMEAGAPATASRYFELTPEQSATLQRELGRNVDWTYTNTCASWASDVTFRVTGQRVDATELGPVETPRALINGINRLEQQRDTTPQNPLRPSEVPARSNSLVSIDPATLETSPVGPGQPYHALHQQAVAAVERLDAKHARTPDAASERLALNATELAARNGLTRVDHVLMGDADRDGVRNLFVVQGGIDDPSHRRVHMPAQLALETPRETTLMQLRALLPQDDGSRQAPRTQEQEPALVTRPQFA